MRWLALVCFVLFSCGVKAPPVAPELDPVKPAAPRMDCSPTDEACDKVDPAYKTRKR